MKRAEHPIDSGLKPALVPAPGSLSFTQSVRLLSNQEAAVGKLSPVSSKARTRESASPLLAPQSQPALWTAIKTSLSSDTTSIFTRTPSVPEKASQYTFVSSQE